MGAVPNVFEFVIAGALEKEGASAESVAAAIAVSDSFLRAVRKGMEQETADDSSAGRAKTIRYALSKALGAATANQMFD